MNYKFLAIIPARSGSKGIKNKNIVGVNGKPLIYYSINEALKSNYISDVIVSTDSEEIAKIAKNLGAKVPFMRPSFLATDTSKTIDTVIYSIEKLTEIGQEYDYVVLLQPTQPLRRSWHIDEAIELIINKKETSLVSVSKVKEHPILIRKIDNNGYIKNLLNEGSTKRRQEFEDFYKVNGAIYINKIDENLTRNTSLNDNKLAYIMDEKYDLDIDEPNDLYLAKIMLNDIENNRGGSL